MIVPEVLAGLNEAEGLAAHNPLVYICNRGMVLYAAAGH